MAIQILKKGFITSVQDLGRNGWQAFGITVGGAMDRTAAKLANIVLGNDENEAVLEMTLVGPSLKFTEDAVISVFGADMSPTIYRHSVPHGKPIQIKKDEILTFGAAKKGMRCYLAVKDGFAIPEVLNSKSTDFGAKLGGLQGRMLEIEDKLPIKKSFISATSWGLTYKLENYINNSRAIRYTRGRQYDLFEPKSKQTFNDSIFTISSASNRMGYRLNGPSIQLLKKRELTTEGTTFGSIQIPPDGQPIILMADRQPTGGYPKIGEVISCDLPRLSQMSPGEKVCFEEISLKEAQLLLLEEHRQIKALQVACKLKWRELDVYN